MQRYKIIITVIFAILSFTSCYHTSHRQIAYGSKVALGSVADSTASDSSASNGYQTFYATHHYSINYNFVVKADSIVLVRQQPEEILSHMPIDSFSISHGEHVVVVEIRAMKSSSPDSVWVQLARDQNSFGWIQESKLLPGVVPDDPISKFISTFSDVHLLIFLIIISIISVCYLVHNFRQKKVKVVHFDDIDSFYPTLLAITVAMAATFYSSIQKFTPETWRNFYYHPSLNPFEEPPILAIFLMSVWVMIIIAIATVDDVYHKQSFSHATMYLWGLFGVCAANYIIFSITTLYYIGYAILVAYIAFAIRSYARTHYYKYVCGVCGAKLKEKGRCPKCGAMNV